METDSEVLTPPPPPPWETYSTILTPLPQVCNLWHSTRYLFPTCLPPHPFRNNIYSLPNAWIYIDEILERKSAFCWWIKYVSRIYPTKKMQLKKYACESVSSFPFHTSSIFMLFTFPIVFSVRLYRKSVTSYILIIFSVITGP